jgi:hypothetical protein
LARKQDAGHAKKPPEIPAAFLQAMMPIDEMR